MTPPHYQDELVTVYAGDCRDVMATLPSASVDAVVTDPPYGLEFMGKEWDRPWAVGMSRPGYTDAEWMPLLSFNDSRNANCRGCGGRQRGAKRCECPTPNWDRHPREDMRAFGEWCETWATECLRVLKPGGHMLAFGGTRTWHRLACAIEDAGFEIRDSITWLYGSGFPKSLDVGKAIDKAAGAERERYARPAFGGTFSDDNGTTYGTAISDTPISDTPISNAARQWDGWGTALKPAHEPIIVARKPLTGTVAANVLTHGTGALNIDGCRVGGGGQLRWAAPRGMGYSGGTDSGSTEATSSPLGRWPANVILDETQAEALDKQSGNRPGFASQNLDAVTTKGEHATWDMGERRMTQFYNDQGGASRFFPTFRYEPKAPGTERPTVAGTAHPTVKPLDLMRWLVRLVTPPGGTVLDPFLGSGTTAEACIIEGFRCVGIENDPTYLPLIAARLTKPIQPDMFGGA